MSHIQGKSHFFISVPKHTATKSALNGVRKGATLWLSDYIPN